MIEHLLTVTDQVVTCAWGNAGFIMHFKRLFLGVGGFFLLSLVVSCATAPASISPETLASVKRIGVLSLVGDKLFHYQIGRTAFGNENEEFDISSLNLDEAWEAAIAQEISKHTQFEVVDLELDRSPYYFSAAIPGSRWPSEPPAPLLKQLAEENSLDAILVHGPAGRDFGRAGVITSGVTLVRENGFIVNPRTNYFLESALHLVDGDTGEVLAIRPIGQKDFLGLYNPLLEPAPHDLVEVWYSDYSAEQIEILKGIFLDLPQPYWEPAITEILSLDTE